MLPTVDTRRARRAERIAGGIGLLRPTSIVICSGKQSVAEAAGGTKVLTPDLFATYFAQAHDRKSSGRQLLLQCENGSNGSEEVGHREEWLLSLEAF